MRWSLIAANAAALLGSAAAEAQAALPFPTSCSGVSANHYSLSVDSNWQATKIQGNLKTPRSLVFDTNGNLLVVQQTNGVQLLTFGSNGCVNSSTTLINNKALNHGLALTPDGKTLYASSETTAYSWTYNVNAKTVSNQVTVVKSMSQGIHSTRTLAIVPTKPNLLLVQVGSNNNWDYAASDPSAGRAAIKVFDMSAVPSGGYNYNTQGYQFGYGLRNEVAFTFDPNGDVWGAENSGDDFTRTINGASTDIHTDNPAEELNYLGDPTTPNNNWYGYPTCFTVWDPTSIRDKTFKTGDQFVVSPNTTFTDTNCNTKATPPRLSFQAHSAPIAAAFDAGAKNLYVTLHGSWDRSPATGYKVVQIPFTQLADGTYDPVAPATSKTGYNDIFWQTNPGSCQSSGLTQSTCVRFSGAVFDSTGTRLYIASDNQAEGELWVLSKKGT